MFQNYSILAIRDIYIRNMFHLPEGLKARHGRGPKRTNLSDVFESFVFTNVCGKLVSEFSMQPQYTFIGILEDLNSLSPFVPKSFIQNLLVLENLHRSHFNMKVISYVLILDRSKRPRMECSTHIFLQF